MMPNQSLAEEIQHSFRTGFGAPFPLGDLKRLAVYDPEKWDRLHGELDLFFSGLAGLASFATRLFRKPKTALMEARRVVDQPFFKKHSSLAGFQKYITDAETPELYHRMFAAEILRQQLLQLIDEILREEDLP